MIRDIVEKFGELCLLWIDAQKHFANNLKEMRDNFEAILEGERIVDSANNEIDSAENSETQLMFGVAKFYMGKGPKRAKGEPKG